jgi:glycosyltransferase involved in cell wall biosynthesis
MLFLCQMFPLPVQSGTQHRTIQLLDRLARRFDVTFLTLAADPGYESWLGELGRRAAKVVVVVPDNKRSRFHRAVYKALYWMRRLLAAESSDRFYNTVPSVNRAIRAELASGDYDILFCEYWFWDPHIFRFPGLKVIDANDVQAMRVESLLERTSNPIERLLAPRLAAQYRRMETEGLARADLVVATTSRDRAAFERMLPPRVDTLVVPTGLDTDYFVPQAGVEPDPRNVVFYGALSNPMNRDAARWLVEDILPCLRRRVPDVRLTLLGAFPPPEILALPKRDPAITVTGYVEDVRRPLSEAGVVVCPLRFGYGIRGRVFELLCMNVPVVATPIAVAGMDLVPGDGIVLADGAAELADAVADLLTDPARRAAVARRGREITVDRMSIAATYDRLAGELLRRVGAESVDAAATPAR